MSAGTTGRSDRLRGLEEQVTALAAEIDRLKGIASFFQLNGHLLEAVWERALDHAADEHDPHRAAAQAQQRRGALRVIDGGAE